MSVVRAISPFGLHRHNCPTLTVVTDTLLFTDEIAALNCYVPHRMLSDASVRNDLNKGHKKTLLHRAGVKFRSNLISASDMLAPTRRTLPMLLGIENREKHIRPPYYGVRSQVKMPVAAHWIVNVPEDVE